MEPLAAQNTTDDLHQAELSIGVAIIPTPPMSEQIAEASLAITRKFENRNIIDNQRFPAHLSLYLGGFDIAFLSELTRQVRAATRPFLSDTFIADRLFRSSIGFIGINCQKSSQLESLLASAVAACGDVHRQSPRYRPSMIERWKRIPAEQQRNLKEFGSYKSAETLIPHFSVADLSDEDDAKTAMNIARKTIILPQSFKIQEVQLVNIGHRNEQWIIIDRWSSSSP